MLHPVVQEIVITYLLESAGEHMHQVTPDKFCPGKSSLTSGISRLYPPGRESNRVFSNVKDPAVGDGDPVGVAVQIFDGIAKPVKGFLNVRTPVFFVKAVSTHS